MIRPVILATALFSISTAAHARTMLSSIYAGVNGGVHYDISHNSVFQRLRDKTTAALGHNYGVQIGFRPFKHMFVEAGVGVYSVAHSFSTADPFGNDEYKNRVLKAGWTSVSIKMGYQMVSRHHFTMSSFAGAQLLADRISSITDFYPQKPEELEAKHPGPSRLPATSEINMSGYRNGLLCMAGLRGEYRLNKRLSMTMDINMNLGIHTLQSGEIHAWELPADGTKGAEMHNYSLTSGSGVGTTIGFNYGLGSR